MEFGTFSRVARTCTLGVPPANGSDRLKAALPTRGGSYVQSLRGSIAIPPRFGASRAELLAGSDSASTAGRQTVARACRVVSAGREKRSPSFSSVRTQSNPRCPIQPLLSQKPGFPGKPHFPQTRYLVLGQLLCTASYGAVNHPLSEFVRDRCSVLLGLAWNPIVLRKTNICGVLCAGNWRSTEGEEGR